LRIAIHERKMLCYKDVNIGPRVKYSHHYYCRRNLRRIFVLMFSVELAMLTLKKKFIKVGKKAESSTTKGQKKTEKSIPIPQHRKSKSRRTTSKCWCPMLYHRNTC
jgi:hypothetical protein